MPRYGDTLGGFQTAPYVGQSFVQVSLLARFLEGVLKNFALYRSSLVIMRHQAKQANVRLRGKWRITVVRHGMKYGIQKLEQDRVG